MVDPPDESEMVARARAGDDLAWETLVRRHQEPVFRLAYLQLGDLEQRVFITSHVLIWTDRGVTYRLETDLLLGEAIVIAESLK